MTDLPVNDPTVIDAAPDPRPRIRVGAVLWGAVLTTLGGAALWIGSSAERRDEARAAVLGLDAFGWTIAIILSVGAVITLVALAAVARSAQGRISSGRRARSDPAPRRESP